MHHRVNMQQLCSYTACLLWRLNNMYCHCRASSGSFGIKCKR